MVATTNGGTDGKKNRDPYLTVTTLSSESLRSGGDDFRTEISSINSLSMSAHLDEPKPSSKLTKRQVAAVIVMAYANFLLGALYSLQAPFFPKEAEAKGATSTQYGLIFGIYEAGVVVFSPFVGKMMPRISPQFLIQSGLFIAGCCCTFFGALQWSPSGWTFVSLAFVIRAAESVGGAAVFTATYTSIAVYFPDRISQLYATAEMCFGIGTIVGPAIGGFLFEIGNFSLPFFVLGAMTLSGGLFSLFVLPEESKETKHCLTEMIISRQFVRLGPSKTEKTSIISLMSNFGITLNVLISVSAFFCIGFNDATLEHHIRQFTVLKPSLVGALFLFSGVIYSIGNQLWGYVADKISNCHVACIVGFVLSALAYTLCGPIYGLPFESNIWFVVVAQALFGLATGGQLVGSFTEGLKETVKRGFPENISTYAMVSALFSSGFSTGGAIGPVAGGFLVEHFGYRKACYGIVGLQFLMLILVLSYNFMKKTSQHGHLKLNPHSLSRKSIDRESGVYNDWINKASIAGIRIVRRNMM